jgi:sigma-B regulation protein RsbU (phosphoserine phosphatase)
MANRRLAEDVAADYFVTLFLARLDPHTRSLVYCSAGHVPGYVLGAGGEVKRALPSTEAPLCVVKAGELPEAAVAPLEAGDLVFLLSDGIVEARGINGTQFGIERALKVVRACRHEPPGDVVAAVVREARAWSQGHQADDMTALVIKAGG